MFEKLKGLVGSMGARGAVATDAPDELPRMQFAAIAAKVGMPEEKVAMMAQMVRQNGMADAQMGFMMQTATAKGVTCEEIMSMLTSMGVAKSQVVRVMSAQGLMAEDEAQRILDAERAAAKRRAAASKTSARKQFARKAIIIAFWLVVWELLDRVVDNRLVLAGPIRTAQALADQVVMPNFWMIVGASFGRIALGFLLSFAVGFLLALVACRVRLFRDFIDPIISLLRTIPVASFIILLLIWVGNQALTVFLAFFIVLPLIYTNMVTGFESVDKQMLEMARVYGLSKWRTFLYVYRPASMPFLLSSTKISLGMTWKSGIGRGSGHAETLYRQRDGHGAHVFGHARFAGVDRGGDGGIGAVREGVHGTVEAREPSTWRIHRETRRVTWGCSGRRGRRALAWPWVKARSRMRRYSARPTRWPLAARCRTWSFATCTRRTVPTRCCGA